MPESAVSTNIGLYRSGVTSPERLRQTSVGRDRTLGNAIESLRGSVGRKSKHHMLFIGPRGIGKTHLLSCIEAAVESDEALRSSLVVARFPEESNQTLSFADFLIGLCRILKDVVEDEPLWAELFSRVETEDDDAIVIDTIVPAIREQNRMRKRTILVMLENVGEIFTRQIRNQQDIASLRKFFMADNGCLLLATAPMHFDGITDIGQPFYDFFDIQILENLSFEETAEVIRRNLEWDGHTDILATFDDMRPRLQALYRMTGGNPRLTMMLYELIANESVTSVQDQFHLLLDRISPFYQSRLNDLSPSQRALLECLAGMRDQDKTPASIAARMRKSQQETSSLLKRLSDAHYLRSTRNPEDKRSRLYTIREGFFDIWLAMNLSRGARKRLPFLLEFFNLFYPSIDERNEKRRLLREQLIDQGSDDAEKALDYLSEVGDDKERAGAKFDMARIYAFRGDAEVSAGYVREAAPLAGDNVSRSIARIAGGAESAPDYLSEIEEMIACWEDHRTGDFESFADRLISMGSEMTLRTFSEVRLSFLRDTLDRLVDPEERIRQRLRLASVLTLLARWKESEEQLRPALDEARDLSDSELVATAMNKLVHLLHETNRIEEAEPLARQALAIDQAAFGNHDLNVARDMNNLAGLLQDTNRFDEAEILTRKALDIFVATLGGHDPTVAAGLNNLSQLLMETNRLEEAEPLLRQALAIDEAAFGNHHPNVATRLTSLASLLASSKRLPRIEEAESIMRRALAIDEAAFGSQHPRVATDLHNLAILLKNTNRFGEAEPILRRALAVDEDAFGNHHPSVSADLYNLALLLKDTDRFEEAKPLLQRSLDILHAFRLKTGHEHPRFETVKLSFQALQRATKQVISTD